VAPICDTAERAARTTDVVTAHVCGFLPISVYAEALAGLLYPLYKNRFGCRICGMYEVCVEAEFSAAHFLSDFHGKCERFHGHNYRVLAYARGEQLDAGGMLIDFGVLKTALRTVCALLDHRDLNKLYENGAAVFTGNPSAERIAHYIFIQLKKLLVQSDAEKLYAVDVYETPRNRARYLGTC